jgi:hypothetical protein
MKFDVKAHRKHLIAGGLLLATATTGFAQFGGIVFDPTSYGELITQATTAYNQLKTMEANIQHFSFKNAWSTTETQMKQANVSNQFGETSGMTTALNTDSPGSSSTAWSMSNVPVSGSTTTYLQGQQVGNSAQLSQLAMIEASDSVSPDCLTAVGQYRAARTASATANADLAQQQLDTSDSTNSEVEQLNLLNASEAQRMTEIQGQGVLNACLASQMTIANMQQRNAAAQDLNTWSFVKQQQKANPTYVGGGSSTDSFIP